MSSARHAVSALATLTLFASVACGGSIAGQDGSSGGGGKGAASNADDAGAVSGGVCEPGRIEPAADGCNVCNCDDTGTWACTHESCGANGKCIPGTVATVDSQCGDRCVCTSKGGWKCELTPCDGTGDNGSAGSGSYDADGGTYVDDASAYPDDGSIEFDSGFGDVCGPVPPVPYGVQCACNESTGQWDCASVAPYDAGQNCVGGPPVVPSGTSCTCENGTWICGHSVVTDASVPPPRVVDAGGPR